MKLTRNFNLIEFQCKDGTPVPDRLLPNVQELADNLQALRDEVGPLHIISGYRTPAHNKKVGGAPKSQHVQAKAADIMSKSLTPRQLRAAILKLIKGGRMKDGGIGLYPSWVHYDIGPARRW